MEESCLIIIDYNKAIENGFIEMDKTIKELMKQQIYEA